MIRKLVTVLALTGLVSLGAATMSAQTTATAPKSIIHVVTLKYKPGTTPEQIKAAMDGVHAMLKEYKGITRVWTKTYSAQGDKTHSFVMEFADEAAFKAYTGSAAQKKWYEVYLPIREESTTFDITN